MEYLIISLQMSAWWGKGSTWITDPKLAQRFNREDAIAFCKRRFNARDGFPTAVPVEVEIVEALAAK